MYDDEHLNQHMPTVDMKNMLDVSTLLEKAPVSIAKMIMGPAQAEPVMIDLVTVIQMTILETAIAGMTITKEGMTISLIAMLTND